MGALRKTLRVVGWVVGVLVALPVTAYLAALAINWRDEPPSPEALAFAAAPLRDATVTDDANGYVYLLGFGAPRDGDPAAIGAERAAWIRKVRADASLSRDSDPYPADASDFGELFPALQELTKPCDVHGAACFDGLTGAREELEATVKSGAWLLDRYRRLLSYRDWADVVAFDFRMPLPGYSSALWAQTLYLSNAWSLAVAGDAAGVRDALDADLELWRLVLRGSEVLLTKSIAMRGVERHFEWGNLILRRLPADRRAEGIPASWRRPLSDEERSMTLVLRGEWKYAHSVMQMTSVNAQQPRDTSGNPLPRPLLERVGNSLAMPFIHLQATWNADAAALLRLDSLLDVPYVELPSALARAPDFVDQRPRGIVDATYNVLGRAMMTRADNADYGARTADLEGMRRAALLAAELRARGVPPESAAAAIALDPARNPYTGEAFDWIEAHSAIGFNGLRHEYRGHSEYLY